MENKLITAGSEGYLKFWDLNKQDNEALLFTTYAHKGPINSVSLSENDERVVSGGSDYLVKVWKSSNVIYKFLLYLT
jgi:WD40 repeat protein